jgi:hypothetical protein
VKISLRRVLYRFAGVISRGRGMSSGRDSKFTPDAALEKVKRPSLPTQDDAEDIMPLRTRAMSGFATRLARAVRKQVAPQENLHTPGLLTPYCSIFVWILTSDRGLAVNPEGTPSIGTVTESIKSLVLGNDTFRRIHFAQHEKALLESIQHGQRPKALFMGCSDSRVIPGTLCFRCRPIRTGILNIRWSL